ncbi:MAG: alpha/beta hydrolase [Alphaproteobacteria bacterium]|nr:alpha/beta hydrolase [Alphaproteobacteria bacterium]
MKRFILALAPLLVLVACANSTLVRQESANHIGMPVQLYPEVIDAGNFRLQAYERIHAKGQPARIYIEGDGHAWQSKRVVSRDPTPMNPVALKLAAQDRVQNVIYLARPCQFPEKTEQIWTAYNNPGEKDIEKGGLKEKCDQAYWTNKRVAPEVIASYQDALNYYRQEYNIPSFEIVGYSGGAAVAAILAAERSDITTLRTVAGNLDHTAFTTLHGVSPMSGSLNPTDYALDLVNVPQRHFVGQRDDIIPPSIYESYAQKFVDKSCLNVTLVERADHLEGMVEQWGALLELPVDCKSVTPDPTAWSRQLNQDGPK